MRYPITIEPGNDTTAWGVVVPDLPGCFSAGDTLEESMIQAEEAVIAWIEVALDAGQDIHRRKQEKSVLEAQLCALRKEAQLSLPLQTA